MNANLPQLPLWRQQVRASPSLVADRWRERLAALPAATRRAVFAWLHPRLGEVAYWHEQADDPGPLAGVPFAVKDLFALPDTQLRASSTFLPDVWQPPATTSTFLEPLLAAGAVPVAKTHLQEFAYGLTGQNPHFGDVPHPWLDGRLSGGSSSGSAWAVASGWVPFAVGTDTGGSLRVPAAWCGLLSWRGTPHDRMDDSFPLAPSFDTGGFLATHTADLATVLAAFLEAAPPLDEPASADLRLAWLAPPAQAPQAIADALEAAGRRLRATAPQSLARDWEHRWSGLAEPFSILQSREALTVHASWFDERREAYDPAVWARIDRGRHWSESQVEAATAIRQELMAWFDEAFTAADVLLLPVTPGPPPPVSALDDSYRTALLNYTAPASLAGLPALTLPLDLGDGQTTAVQMIYPASARMRIFPLLPRVAAALGL